MTPSQLSVITDVLRERGFDALANEVRDMWETLASVAQLADEGSLDSGSLGRPGYSLSVVCNCHGDCTCCGPFCECVFCRARMHTGGVDYDNLCDHCEECGDYVSRNDGAAIVEDAWAGRQVFEWRCAECVGVANEVRVGTRTYDTGSVHITWDELDVTGQMLLDVTELERGKP